MSRRASGRRATPAAPALGLHVPGRSWLHRAPVAAKIAALAVLSLALLLVPAHAAWWVGSLAAGAVVVAAASARLPLADVARALRGVLLIAGAAAAYQWWRAGWETALGVASVLVALVLAGLVVTMTTPMDAMLDGVVRLARPLRRVGVPPERVALGVALTLRGVPALLTVAGQSRDAARARGLERSPRAVLVPTALRTVAHARRTGEALAARGLVD